MIETTSKLIVVNNLPAHSGKPVVDPDLEDVKIIPIVKKENGFTKISIQVTGKVYRLWDWSLMKGRQKWKSGTPGMEGFSSIPDGRERVVGFQEPLPNDVSLSLEVLTPGPRHLVEFQMSDIELP